MIDPAGKMYGAISLLRLAKRSEINPISFSSPGKLNRTSHCE
jgi:hypothetical protein